jgi:hypothetical protein
VLRTRWLPVALVAGAVISLAGCTGDDAADSAAPPRASTASESSAGAPRTTAGPTPLASLAGLVPGRTIDDSQGVKITVMPVTLERRDKLVLLEIAARNEDASERANLSNSLRGSGILFDEVTLLDPAHGKRYMVARDSKNSCLCTSFSGGLSVEPGGTGLVSAYFAAPPADVTQLDVVVTAPVGTFTKVPVS